jgi:hypothetical protein
MIQMAVNESQQMGVVHWRFDLFRNRQSAKNPYDLFAGQRWKFIVFHFFLHFVGGCASKGMRALPQRFEQQASLIRKIVVGLAASVSAGICLARRVRPLGTIQPACVPAKERTAVVKPRRGGVEIPG